ncbi:hypothetical protein CRUP_026735, partial [Coryphaenoides rupestris]
MEVLANAAVAEICKLVDDDYAVVSLQMSQCQRENKALKRKLHLMELKMARAFAERRLRDSAAGTGRALSRVHVGANDRFRSSSSAAAVAASGVVFEEQMDMVPWAGAAAPGAAGREPATCDLQQDTAADVELVEAELVKQEKMEEAEEEVQEEVQLIRADGESWVSGGLFQSAGERRTWGRPGPTGERPCSAGGSGIVSGPRPAGRPPEEWRSVAPLLSLKPQLRALVHGPDAPLHPLPPLDPAHAFSHVTNGDTLVEEFCDQVLEDAANMASRPSCSYSAAS